MATASSSSYLGTIGSTGGDAGDQYTGLDRFGRIINQKWSNSSGGTIDGFQYGYDANSNVTYEQNAVLTAHSETYVYDGLNRLTNYSSGTMNSSHGIASPATLGWNLDAQGNWINSSSGSTVTARTNNEQNQVTTVGSATLNYDLNGNMTTDQNGQEYVYDAWNRLVTVKDSSGTPIAAYSYDALGRQVTQTEAGITTDLYYSNQDQVLQENQGSMVTAEHVWSPFYVDAMIQTVTDPQVTTNQSNGSVDTGFGMNTSNHTTTNASDGAAKCAAADGSDILIATMSGSTIDLVWYTAEGQLDTAYGSGTGIVSLSSTGWTLLGQMLVQGDGDIDLTVHTSAGGMQVAQLNADGSIDGSFGSGGLETIGASLPEAKALAMAPDGDLLVGGSSGATFTVAAVHSSSGLPDDSFNGAGTASVQVFSTGTNSLTLAGMGVTPDGQAIIGGGFSHNVSGNTSTGIVLVALRLDKW